MNLANKSFRDNKTGEIVKVIDSFDNIVILESKEKVAVDRLLDPGFYTEQIDAKNFFDNQGAYNALAEKIKNIPTENIVDSPGESNVVMVDGIKLPSANESAVIMSDPEDEKAELARKYGVIDNTSSVQNQNQAFAKILGEGSEDELPKVQPRKTEVVVNNVQHIEVNREYIQPQRIEDPIINMFKGVKRNVSFKMNIEISNKIPRLDFIEMMEDSYEISIIDYLAEEFTQNLLKDPSLIKEMIKDKITKVVYGTGVVKVEEKHESEPKKATKKAPVKKATKKAPEKPAKKVNNLENQKQ